MKSARMLIVEDVDEMRELLALMFDGVPDVRVSGTARNAVEARTLFMRDRPDLVLLDEILPGEAGLDLVSEFASSGTRVVLISGMDQPDHPLPFGAALRLAKPSWETLSLDLPRFIRSIREVMQSKSE